MEMFQAENLGGLAIVLFMIALLLNFIVGDDPDKEYKSTSKDGVVTYWKKNGSFRVDVRTLGNSKKLREQIEAAENLFEEENNRSK